MASSIQLVVPRQDVQRLDGHAAAMLPNPSVYGTGC
jgi:hypothetical protein